VPKRQAYNSDHQSQAACVEHMTRRESARRALTSSPLGALFTWLYVKTLQMPVVYREVHCSTAVLSVRT
jgi:hypothetical protein